MGVLVDMGGKPEGVFADEAFGQFGVAFLERFDDVHVIDDRAAGAVVFCDFWLLPKLGLRSSYAVVSGIRINWAAAAAWIVTLSCCTWLALTGRLGIFFVSLPGWFLASLIFIVVSKMIQKPTTAAA